MYKMHHPKPDIDGLYVIRKGGGRGLLQIEATYEAEIINIAEYLNAKYTDGPCINSVKSNKISKPNMNSTIKVGAKVAGELNHPNENSDTKREAFITLKEN